MLHRRRFLAIGLTTATHLAVSRSSTVGAVDDMPQPEVGEDLTHYIHRVKGGWDQTLYRQLYGAANDFKEGDEIIGVAATSEQMRDLARHLLSNTTIHQIDAHPLLEDTLLTYISRGVDHKVQSDLSAMTLRELKAFLLEKNDSDIHAIRSGLSSDVIAGVVRLMTNPELIQIGAKVFNPLPNSQLGAKGYMGARIQPNSPTDNVDDIQWQVFDAFAYAVGDVLIGTNPVSSTLESVATVQAALQEILVSFGIADVLPHCVLSHIDVQAEVEQEQPGLTELWFQSIAGNDSANATFDISVEKMIRHAQRRVGRFGLYFETGQGADFTNGHGYGVDMVVHESRKYGFARALIAEVSTTVKKAGSPRQPWVHLNDVAGFIGPEVFRSKEQLVRCCLEDIVMGKLHGLMIGLDICSTLHMNVSLDDLGWCIDQIMPANPGYLMALPTRIDPMLGYLTTGYHDHVHIREKFGYRVNDRMWQFYQSLGIIDSSGKPTEHFGDPKWVYLQFRRRRNDLRSDADILAEADQRITEVESRGVLIARGSGASISDLPESLANKVHHIYTDAKACIWKELDDSFIATIPDFLRLQTKSANRNDYILHPVTGEHLSPRSQAVIDRFRQDDSERSNTQIVISDGLNALAIMDGDQLSQLLRQLRAELVTAGYLVSMRNIVVSSGRVRAGYRIGEALFVRRKERCTMLHIIGERPGSGHHTMSIYMTSADGATWGTPGKVDHNITKVVSGIANTALLPGAAAAEAVKILKTM
ncbi:MAG: ethanolamine ammonia-lyase subunit EutB [Planctomycetota bacterium]